MQISLFFADWLVYSGITLVFKFQAVWTTYLFCPSHFQVHCYVSAALFTKILTIKNCRKCKTKIKKSFTKILTIILSVKIVLTLRVKLVLTLRVKLPCPKCKILILRDVISHAKKE
jgi:hypothetical protein